MPDDEPDGKPAPFTDEEVKEWLHTTGGPLEMRVAQKMHAHGLGVEQGHYYTDPDEAKPREIDVIAYGSSTFGVNDAVLELVAVVECKNAPTPWVLYRGDKPDPHGGVTRMQRIASDAGRIWLNRIASIEEIASLHLWTLETAAGYALATSDPQRPRGARGARRSQQVDDLNAYKAVYAVTKASLALADELTNQERIRRVSVVLPVIVIAGQLFEAFLDDGQVVVHEVRRQQLLWSHPPSELGRVIIDVMVEDELDGYAAELRDAHDAAIAYGSEAAAAVLSSSEYIGLY